MSRSAIPACGALLAVALVIAGLSVPDTPASAAAAADVWTPPSSADKNAYEGANAPRGPVPDGSVRTFTSSTSQARVAPGGTVAGAPGIGALPYFGLQEFNLSPNLVARVNVANGNLLLTANDGTLSGPGVSLRNDRFYNGLSTSVGAFGGGWSSSLFEQDVRLKIAASSITYVGANGFEAVFKKGTDGWEAPSGLNATLVKHAPEGDPYQDYLSEYSLTFNKTGERTEFSGSGWILGQYDRNGIGNKWNYPEVYDDQQGEVSVTNAAGRQYTVTHERGEVVAIADSAGREVSYDRGERGEAGNGEPVTRVNGSGGYWEQYKYDAQGRIQSIRFSGTTAGVTPEVVFSYDSAHRIIALEQHQVESSGSDWTYSEFSYGSGQTRVADSNENVSVFKYDAQGRITSATDPLGRIRSNTYTSNSDVTTSTDALASGSTPGNSTTYAYDALGNQTTVTLPTGAGAAAAYSAGSNCTGSGGTAYQVKCTTSDTGARTVNTYDTAGNLLSTKDGTQNGTGAVSQTNTYQSTNNVTCGGVKGQICSTADGNNARTSYTYDAKGNLLKVTPPSPLGPTSYTYDALGRTVSVTDGNLKKTSYEYDDRDQLVRTTWADGSSLTSTYVSGLKVKDLDSVGGQRNFRYDYRGLITYEDAPGAGATTYQYDRAGNLTSTMTSAGTTRYGYNESNQLTQIVEPNGSCSGATPAAGSGCVQFTYDGNGAETKRTFPGGATVTTTRDKSSRPMRITAKDSAGKTASDIGYSYSADGSGSPASDRANIQKRISHSEVGVAAGAGTAYAYDSLNRVTSATERSGTSTTASWSYSYDKAGNRVSQNRTGATGATAGAISYTYNAANQLTSSTGAGAFAYDAVGNQTQNGISGKASVYNSRGAVTAIGATSFTSFGQGNALTTARSNPSSTFGTTSQGLTSEASAGSTITYTRSASGDLVSARLPGAASLYYVQDLIGSVVGMFDKAGIFKGGYSYSPYGELRASTDNSTVKTNSMRYAGGYYDSSVGLYKFGARYYDPTQGRFTQFDPSGQESNPYAYATCNPINNTDPTGLSCVSELAIAIGATLLLAAEVVGTIIAALAPEPVITKAAAVGIALTISGTAAVAFGSILQAIGCLTGQDL